MKIIERKEFDDGVLSACYFYYKDSHLEMFHGLCKNYDSFGNHISSVIFKNDLRYGVCTHKNCDIINRVYLNIYTMKEDLHNGIDIRFRNKTIREEIELYQKNN